MVNGITPVDNAFELVGLQQCTALMRVIFVETWAGKAVFVAGFMMALTRSLKDTNFRSLIFFCAIFFSCLFLFILPCGSLQVPVSSMEEKGYGGLTTETILRKAGIDAVSMNPVMAMIGQGMSAFCNGAVSVLDRLGPHHASFLKEPFITAKLCLVTKERINEGITQPLLKERLVRFYQDHYFPAFRAIKEEKNPDLKDVWPGSGEIVPRYSSSGSSDWQTLEDDLYKAINIDGAYDRVVRDYTNEASLKELAVRALMDRDIVRVPRQYTVLSFAGKIDGIGAKEIVPLRTTRTVFDQMVQTWLSGFPIVYGLCLWSAWGAFPFVLIFLFLSGDLMLLGVFFKCLMILKLIPFFWALIDKATVLVFDIQTGLSGGKVMFWDMPLAGIVAVLGSVVLVLPLVMVFKRKGSL